MLSCFRPVLVELRSSVAAFGVLKKSQALRNSDKFKPVFLPPNWTVAQRLEQRELVCSMKKQAAEDKSRRFFIRTIGLRVLRGTGPAGTVVRVVTLVRVVRSMRKRLILNYLTRFIFILAYYIFWFIFINFSVPIFVERTIFLRNT